MKKNLDNLSVLSDQKLWTSLQEGHRAALQVIYQKHVDALLQYGYRFSADTTLIEDSIHDLFLHIWERRKNLSSTDSIRKYLLVALRRQLIKKIKKSHQVVSKDPAEDFTFQCEIAIDQLMIQSEMDQAQKNALKKVFAQLSQRQREAIYLKYYENLDYQTICEMMGISYQSARNLIFKGLESLRKWLMIALMLLFF